MQLYPLMPPRPSSGHRVLSHYILMRPPMMVRTLGLQSKLLEALTTHFAHMGGWVDLSIWMLVVHPPGAAPQGVAK
jgi:hypothetical protein